MLYTFLQLGTITYLKKTTPIEIKMKNKYRFESGSVYEFDEESNAYIFIGKLNGRTKKQFLADWSY
jgi:hypothetical protein